ncbi:MAG: hypothetical protein EHM70_19850 [Chloroflexota bacterium]|nr:MAG: hypothetical protein EHM70_19850 [Chloroflexota bacterium]
MISDRLDRCLPDRLVRNILKSIEEEMGLYSLHLMLHQAGLERFVSAARSGDMRASECTSLLKGIRDYYGRGARGSLIRIGSRWFELLVRDCSLVQKIKVGTVRLLPVEMRRLRILDFLARQLCGGDGRIAIHTLDHDIIFVDQTSQFTFGLEACEPVCWMTQGMIQRALAGGGESEPDIEEISCQAMGGDACKFHIRF